MQVIEIKIVARGSTVQVYENRLVGLSPVVCSRWPVGCGSINGLGLGAIDGGWRIVKERLCCFGLGPTRFAWANLLQGRLQQKGSVRVWRTELSLFSG